VTAGGMMQALGMREVRESMRAVVARVEAGEALVVLRDGQPAAVMLGFAEGQRWQQIERSLSSLHGLELYPELARDTAELARLVRREARPSASAVRGLAEQPRDILAPLRTMGITDARAGFAQLLDEVGQGRTMTIVSGGRFAATLVSPREFDRLRALDRTVGWFRSAGVDLATADEAAIAAFVREFATRPAAADVRREAV
jgi:prevent-host-death family protein